MTSLKTMYRDHVKATDKQHRASELIPWVVLENDFKIYLATRPEHAQLIGCHHRTDLTIDPTSETIPDTILDSADDANSRGFDRLIVHVEHWGSFPGTRRTLKTV